jgi:hypothetical protein
MSDLVGDKGPLMPKATAIWLVDNTSLTFRQIAEFCNLHQLEVEAIANGDFDNKVLGLDPIASLQLTAEEIKRCEADEGAQLRLKNNSYLDEKPKRSAKVKKYTPLTKRHDKPDAVAWLLKYYPNMSESDICSVIGTTKATIRAIRNKTYKNYSKIVPKSPVFLGLCSEAELDQVISKLTREQNYG